MSENTEQYKYKSVELNEYPLEPGRYLIEASAGTGKTFTIAKLVCRLVIEKNIPMSRLLVTTFTNAAAAENGDFVDRRGCDHHDPRFLFQNALRVFA